LGKTPFAGGGVVDGEGDAEEEEEDDEGVGPDLFRMDQAGC
jgi:hypothetical protein